MPSIALFIRELLAEEKYSTDFIDRVEERIQGLNAAQLQGMYNHLKLSLKNARSEIWKNANQEIMTKIEGVLKLRVDEAQKERKILEEYYLKQRQKQQLRKVAAKERIKVMEMIEQNARIQAETEVKENEQKRQAAERVFILQEIGRAEEKRNLWWKIFTLFFICALAGISYVMYSNLLILLPSVFGLAIIYGYLIYRAHLWTNIQPINISPDYLQNQIDTKAENFKKQALSSIRDKERKFHEQQRRETLERRRLRAERKEKQREEMELLEKERMERIRQAKLLLAKSVKDENLSLTSSKEVQPPSLVSRFNPAKKAKVAVDCTSPLSFSDSESVESLAVDSAFLLNGAHNSSNIFDDVNDANSRVLFGKESEAWSVDEYSSREGDQMEENQQGKSYVFPEPIPSKEIGQDLSQDQGLSRYKVLPILCAESKPMCPVNVEEMV